MKIINEEELIGLTKETHGTGMIQIDAFDIESFLELGEFHLEFTVEVGEFYKENIPSYIVKCLGDKFNLFSEAKGVFSFIKTKEDMTFDEFVSFYEHVENSISENATMSFNVYQNSASLEKNMLHICLFGVPFDNKLINQLRNSWNGTDEEFSDYLNKRRVRAIFK